MLQRGEKINDLVDRSNALSAQSKMFYKTAKKVGSRDMSLSRQLMVSTIAAKLVLRGDVDAVLFDTGSGVSGAPPSCVVVYGHVIYIGSLDAFMTLRRR